LTASPILMMYSVLTKIHVCVFPSFFLKLYITELI
jgi:hypothetical protein